MAGRPKDRLLLLGALCLLYLLAPLGQGLFEDSEARYVEASWEMAQSGDWVTPRVNHIKHFHKPPLTYWLTAASLKLLGKSEAAARLPQILTALAIVGLTLRLAQALELGLLPGLILATSLEFWLVARLVYTDMFLTGCITWALVAAYMVVVAEREHPGWWLSFWVANGLAILIKGPVGPLLVALGLLGLTRRDLKFGRLRPVAGLAVMLAVAVPWFVVVCQRNPELWNYFLVFQTVDRVATTVHGRAGPPWFYLPVLLVGFFPWAAALAVALVRAWRTGEVADRFLLAWFALPVLMFSCIGSKLPPYILPTFPAGALLVARYWDRSLARLTGLSLAFLGIAATIFLALAPPPDVVGVLGLLLPAVAAWALSGLVVSLKPTEEVSLPAITAGMVVSLFLIAVSVGRLDEQYTARAVARVVESKTIDEVAFYGNFLYSLPYYLDRRIVHISYPRETQFETSRNLDGFYFRDYEEYWNQLTPGEQVIVVMRRSDDDPKRFPGWERVEKGHYLILSGSKQPEAQP
ncbi:MAG: ArnT family glycosyltransferase [Vulcanimicrobiota bacterium]